MSTILNEIINKRKQVIESEKKVLSMEEIKKLAAEKKNSGYVPVSFLSNYNIDEPFLIAEIKKGSPSKGLIRENFDVSEIAKSYENSKYVKAVSILTEPDFFYGNYENIEIAKDVLTKPVLMKDFIFDEYQIYKGYLLGASAILLIASILSDDEIISLSKIAKELSMEVLFETHTTVEFQRAIDLKMKIVGINNRDLKSFNTDYRNTISIVEKMGKPKDSILISESGISDNKTVTDLRLNNIDGLLVGETFMREDNIALSIASLIDG